MKLNYAVCTCGNVFLHIHDRNLITGIFLFGNKIRTSVYGGVKCGFVN